MERPWPPEEKRKWLRRGRTRSRRTAGARRGGQEGEGREEGEGGGEEGVEAGDGALAAVGLDVDDVEEEVEVDVGVEEGLVGGEEERKGGHQVVQQQHPLTPHLVLRRLHTWRESAGRGGEGETQVEGWHGRVGRV